MNLLNTFLGAPGVLEKKSGLLGGSCLTAGIPVVSPFLTKGGEWVYEMHRMNTYILEGKTGSKRPPPKKSEGKNPSSAKVGLGGFARGYMAIFPRQTAGVGAPPALTEP